MSPDAKKLRQAIQTGQCEPSEIVAALAALPPDEIRRSVTLTAAWIAFMADSPQAKLEALGHLSRRAESIHKRPSKAAADKARKASLATWTRLYGPGFDLYAAIEDASRALDIPLVTIAADGRRTYISKPDQRKLSLVIYERLRRDYPERWGVPGVKMPRFDPSAFHAAARCISTVRWPDDIEPEDLEIEGEPAVLNLFSGEC
jgi:hypothetical protein